MDIQSKTISRLIIVIPIFNDWTSLQSLVPLIDRAFSKSDYIVELLLIDDASTEAMDGFSSSSWVFEKIENIICLQLDRNVGHQNAISIGLLHISEKENYDAVGIMDADGQDKPADMVRLVDNCLRRGRKEVIFARRKERAESNLFKVFYFLYITAFRISTGIRIRYGHFSVIPTSILSKIVELDGLSVNFVSSILRGRIPYAFINTSRGERLRGKSKMMFSSLVMHGLSAFVVCNDIIKKRLRRLIITLIALSLCGAATAGLIISNVNAEIEPGVFWAFPITGVVIILAVSSYWLVVSQVDKVFKARLDSNNQTMIRKIVEIYRRQTQNDLKSEFIKQRIDGN